MKDLKHFAFHKDWMSDELEKIKYESNRPIMVIGAGNPRIGKSQAMLIACHNHQIPMICANEIGEARILKQAEELGLTVETRCIEKAANEVIERTKIKTQEHMMNPKGILSMMGMMLAMSDPAAREAYGEASNSEIIKKSKEPVKQIIPKGCKKYYFTRGGRFDTDDSKWDDVDYIFDCIAMNEKSAMKKFEKWEARQV